MVTFDPPIRDGEIRNSNAEIRMPKFETNPNIKFSKVQNKKAFGPKSFFIDGMP